MQRSIEVHTKPKKRAPVDSEAPLYRPVKRPVNMLIDADIVAWLKSEPGPYQTRINRILRDAMNETAAGRRARKIGVTE